jgi:N-acetylneuraminic acid mutarotase
MFVKRAERVALPLRWLFLCAVLGLLGACYYYAEDEDDGVDTGPPPVLVSIAVNPGGGPIAAGLTQQFTATGTYDKGFSVDESRSTLWSSSDSRIATVSSTGLVMAVSPGSTTISATLAGKTGSAPFSVSSVPLIAIAVTPLSASLKQGHSRQFSALGTYADMTTGDITLAANWSSSDDTSVTISNAVDSKGFASGLRSSAQTVAITATFNGISGSAALTLTAPGWRSAGVLLSPREGHSATLLANGKVLIAGGRGASGLPVLASELFDPATGLSTYTTAGLNFGRYGHTATLLPNGNVLLVGAIDGNFQDAPELYDPATGTWTLVNRPGANRTAHASTLLANGKVLIVGGISASARCMASTELYDPATGQWTDTGSLIRGRCLPSATLVNDGKVFVFGGLDANSAALAYAEVYDPATGHWVNGGTLNSARYGHSATLLANGMVLLAGGSDGPNLVADSALFEPNLGHEFVAGRLSTPRTNHTATLLPDGQVLLAGGVDPGPVAVRSTELYAGVGTSGVWPNSGNLDQGRAGHTATLLRDGTLIVTGGVASGLVLNSIEAY